MRQLIAALLFAMAVGPASAQTTGQETVGSTAKADPIRLKVVDEHGKPVPGLEVRVTSRHLRGRGGPIYDSPPPGKPLFEKLFTTGGDGVCALEGCDEDSAWHLRAVAAQDGLVGHYDFYSGTIGETKAAPAGHTLVLRPEIRIEFRVRRPDGTPVRGLLLRLKDYEYSDLINTGSWRTTADGVVDCRFDQRASPLRVLDSLEMSCRRRTGLKAKRLAGDSPFPVFVITAPFEPDIQLVWNDKRRAKFTTGLWEVPRLSQWRLRLYSGRRQWTKETTLWIPDVDRGKRWYATVEVLGEAPSGTAFRIPNGSRERPDQDFPYKPTALDEMGSAYRINMPTLGKNRFERVRILDLNGEAIPNTRLHFRTEYPDNSRRHRDQDSSELFRLVEKLRARARETELMTDAQGFVSVPVWNDHSGYLFVSWPAPSRGAHRYFAGTQIRSFVGRHDFRHTLDQDEPTKNVHTLLQFAASGRVVDRNQQPVPSAEVEITRDPALPDSRTRPGLWWGTKTDEQGRFTIYQPFALQNVALRTRLWGDTDWQYGPTTLFELGQREILLLHPSP